MYPFIISQSWLCYCYIYITKLFLFQTVSQQCTFNFVIMLFLEVALYPSVSRSWWCSTVDIISNYIFYCLYNTQVNSSHLIGGSLVTCHSLKVLMYGDVISPCNLRSTHFVLVHNDRVYTVRPPCIPYVSIYTQYQSGVRLHSWQ